MPTFGTPNTNCPAVSSAEMKTRPSGPSAATTTLCFVPAGNDATIVPGCVPAISETLICAEFGDADGAGDLPSRSCFALRAASCCTFVVDDCALLMEFSWASG